MAGRTKKETPSSLQSEGVSNISSYFSELINNNKFLKQAVEDKILTPEIIPSGMTLLDSVLYEKEGIPTGQVLHIFGLPSTGKTLLASRMALSYLQMGGSVMWFDQEDGQPRGTLELGGIDFTKDIMIVPPTTAEKAFSAISQTIKFYSEKKPESQKPMLIVLDSLGGSLTDDGDERDLEQGRKVGDLAKLTNDFMRKNVPYLPRTKITLVILNRCYLDITAFTPAPGIPKPYIPVGGTGVRFRSVIEIQMKKAKQIYAKSNGKLIRIELTLTTVKNKTMPCNLTINLPVYTNHPSNKVVGFDNNMSNIDFLIENGVWKIQKEGRAEKVVTHTGEVFPSRRHLRDLLLEEGDESKKLLLETRALTKNTFISIHGL